VSELVTNAVLHGSRAGDIRLVVGLGSERVRIEVHDPGTGFEHPPRIAQPRVGQPHGRGLYLVSQLPIGVGTSGPVGHGVWLEPGRR
jgi:anti-sigma regulatory factor (Ser/Thr protein kinase)